MVSIPVHMRFEDGLPADELRFSSEIECAHCGTEIDVPLSTSGGRFDHWLYDGEKVACAACGLFSTVILGEDEDAYFAECDDDGCEVCRAARR